jgi:hypothetical protein
MRRSPVLIVLASRALAVSARGGGSSSFPSPQAATKFVNVSPGGQHPDHDAIGPVTIPGERLALDQQPQAWNALDKLVMRKYFPLFPTYYGGEAMAHGSKVQGMADDTTTGMPTWKQIWVAP